MPEVMIASGIGMAPSSKSVLTNVPQYEGSFSAGSEPFPAQALQRRVLGFFGFRV